MAKKSGKWYWGFRCGMCGEFMPFIEGHETSEVKTDPDTKVRSICPKCRFDATYPAKLLIRVKA